MRLFKFLAVLFLVFLFQFPVLAADCLLPAFPFFPPDAYAVECPTNGGGSDTSGCSAYSSEVMGTWAECRADGSFYVYALYHRFITRSPTLGRSAYIASSLFVDYTSFNPPSTFRSGVFIGSSVYNSAYNSIGTIINESAFCWCPPDSCSFPECIGTQISKRFPFDIFLGVSQVPITCPGVEFFGFYYDLCFIYEALRFLKYPVAVALLVKLVMAL